jgi:membrane-bound lytic murein transglycosylase D
MFAQPCLSADDLISPEVPQTNSATNSAPISVDPHTAAAPPAGETAAPEPRFADGVETPAGVAPFAPAQPPSSLWARIRRGFAMPDLDGRLVRRHEVWYLNRPDYLQRVVERSKLYLYFIVDELEKRNMPMEIALLPMIESAYNPTAYSRARASGIWQFIPSTGRLYGLRQNYWYDGRRDVMQATRAALDYLQLLHEKFNDWPLALAAYNWGENGVGRAIARNRKLHKPTDYASLSMPRETRNYLPKLQAVKNIIANPGALGIPLDDVPDRPYFTTVATPANMDVTVAAKLAGMSLEDFLSLNPGFNRPVITPASSTTLLLPVDNAMLFRTNLESNDRPLVSWQTYTMKKSDKLEELAQRFGMSLAQLKQINGITSYRPPRNGQTLLVRLNDDGTPSNLAETYDNPDFQAPHELYEHEGLYRVRRGDTLSTIARRHHVTVGALMEWNHLRNHRLHVGQKLAVYQGRKLSQTALMQ